MESCNKFYRIVINEDEQFNSKFKQIIYSGRGWKHFPFRANVCYRCYQSFLKPPKDSGVCIKCKCTLYDNGICFDANDKEDVLCRMCFGNNEIKGLMLKHDPTSRFVDYFKNCETNDVWVFFSYRMGSLDCIEREKKIKNKYSEPFVKFLIEAYYSKLKPNLKRLEQFPLNKTMNIRIYDLIEINTDDGHLETKWSLFNRDESEKTTFEMKTLPFNETDKKVDSPDEIKRILIKLNVHNEKPIELNLTLNEYGFIQNMMNQMSEIYLNNDVFETMFNL